jgi:hypothetical protein
MRSEALQHDLKTHDLKEKASAWERQPKEVVAMPTINTPLESCNPPFARDRAAVVATAVWQIVNDTLRDPILRGRLQDSISHAASLACFEIFFHSVVCNDTDELGNLASELGDEVWAIVQDAIDDPIVQARAKSLTTTRIAAALRDELADVVREVFENRPHD